MLSPLPPQGRIPALLELGLYCIKGSWAVLNSADAIVGWHSELIAAFPTQAQAQDYFCAKGYHECSDPEQSYDLLCPPDDLCYDQPERRLRGLLERQGGSMLWSDLHALMDDDQIQIALQSVPVRSFERQVEGQAVPALAIAKSPALETPANDEIPF